MLIARCHCLSDLEYQGYAALMPVYFPRSDLEAQATAARVPEDIGNEHGEPVIDERTIRISETLMQTNGMKEGTVWNARLGETERGLP